MSEEKDQTGRIDLNPDQSPIRRLGPALFLTIWLLFPTGVFAGEARTVDPSGGWKNLRGVLSLMLSGDALSFSYSSVFGITAHICDGAGVAGLHADGEYRYVDESGTVSFFITPDQVRMVAISGVPSFCGANWPGEVYERDGYEPLSTCKVATDKSRFHVVMPAPPDPRKGYVVKGDTVEIAPVRHEGADGWVLARFKNDRGSSVGLLLKETLDCAQ